MTFYSNPLSRLNFMQLSLRLPPASHRLPLKILNFRIISVAAMLIAACPSCASDPDFSNTNTEIRPASETASTNPLIKAVVETDEETTNAAGKVVRDSSNSAMDLLDNNYRLALGDSIDFQVLEDKEDPEDKGEPQIIMVSDSGDIEVPYIGRYPAQGKTCKELASQLKTELQKKYYYQATVIVSVRSMATKGVVYLMGGVRSPGPLQLPRDEVLTVSKAILRAGGFDDFADQKHVQVTRKAEGGTNTVFTINVSAILDHGHTEEDQRAEPGDLIYVPEKTFRY